MTIPFNGADAMVRMLQYNGVKHIFGLCGDTSLPFYDAMARLDHGMDHILTRDERSAGYMADAYARVTGKVGVCEGPSGGGATYLLPGLVEAVSQQTGCACSLANPFEGMEIGSGVRLKRMAREAPSYLTSCGLAMRRFQE